MSTRFILFICLFFVCRTGYAQPDAQWIRTHIEILSDSRMAGRGYVEAGTGKAARFLAGKLQQFGTRLFPAEGSYLQTYYFPIQSFPRHLEFFLDGQKLSPGIDFLVDAASPSIHFSHRPIKVLDLSAVRSKVDWDSLLALRDNRSVYLLKAIDTALKYLSFSRWRLARSLPAGTFVVPQKQKLIWTASTDTAQAVVFYLADHVGIKKVPLTASAFVETRYFDSFRAQNVAAFVSGTDFPDQFFVFTAHFDHLGKMGSETIFPGAHDNASGTALMLALAHYFSRHPPPYSVAFLAFSGEEAGLIGSRYYVQHPIFPLKNIKLVINLDMTGDATNGITVVNAKNQNSVFEELLRLNERENLLPEIKERDQAANSDHYSFSEANVPAIFIYGNGTKPHYHDVFDQPDELSLKNIPELLELLITYVEEVGR